MKSPILRSPRFSRIRSAAWQWLRLLFIAALLPGCTRAIREQRALSRADRFFQAGDYNSARIEYMKVLQLDRSNTRAFQRIGMIWMEDGDAPRAFGYLSEALKLDPKDVATHTKLGSALFSLGDIKAARDQALTAIQLDPSSGEAAILLVNTAVTPDMTESARAILAKVPNQETSDYQLALAGILLRKNDLAGATQAVQKAVSLDPKAPAPHVALADLLFARRDPAKGLEELRTASDCSPPRGAARMKYAEYLMSTGSAAQAGELLAQASAVAPDFLPAKLMKARLALMEGKVDDALNLAINVLGRDPLNIDATVLYAEIWMAKGDPDKALAALQQLGKPYQALPVVIYESARAQLEKGDVAQAIISLKQAIASSPGYTDAILLLATTNLRTGNAAAVPDAMLNLLKRQPSLKQATLVLIDAYRSLKQYDKAIAAIQKLIQARPSDPNYQLMLGTTYREAGKAPEARTAFEQAQHLAPRELAPAAALVDMDLAAGKPDDAIERIQSQIASFRDQAGANLLLGKVYLFGKDWTDAKAVLAKALSQNPNLAPGYRALADACIGLGDAAGAAKAIEGCLAKNPRDARSLSDLGSFYTGKGQMDKAIPLFERLLAVDQNSIIALNNLAYCYSRRPDMMDKARGYAERAYTLRPDDPNIKDTLAWILYQTGDYQRGLSIEQDAARADNDPEILLHLGCLECSMGNNAAGRAALEKATAAAANYPGKAEIASRLALMDKVESNTAGKADIEAFLQSHPRDVYASVALGDLLRRSGDAPGAAAAYQQAVDANPRLGSATVSLAELCAGPLHDTDRAYTLARMARELMPADPAVTALLGRIAYAKGEFGSAYSLLQEASAHLPDDPSAAPALAALAWAAYSQGAIPEAIAAMQRAGKADAPGSPQAADAARFLALADPDSNPGEPAITAALSAVPDYAPALIARARLRARRSDLPGAESDYAAVLARFPDFAPAQSALARLYLKEPANQAMAFDLAEKAHHARPDDPDAAELLATASCVHQQYPYAVQLFRQVEETRSLGAESLYYLGAALMHTGDRASSRDTLQKSIAAGLGGPQLADARRLLAQLGSK